ncbi:MAG: hypothetical protein VX916_02675 [Planctomycetota bacterium]|nr:hypothetical protein [Planctomycetota bacterium]
MLKNTKKWRLVWGATICITVILSCGTSQPKWRSLHDHHPPIMEGDKLVMSGAQQSWTGGYIKKSSMSKFGRDRLAWAVEQTPKTFSVRVNDWEIIVTKDFGKGSTSSIQREWPDRCPDISFILPDGHFIHWRGSAVEVDGETIKPDKPGTYHIDAAGNVTFDPEAVPYWDTNDFAPPSGEKW